MVEYKITYGLPSMEEKTHNIPQAEDDIGAVMQAIEFAKSYNIDHYVLKKIEVTTLTRKGAYELYGE